MSPARPGWITCRTKSRRRVAASSSAAPLACWRLRAYRPGESACAPRGQVAQQLPGSGVGRLPGSHLVKSADLELHHLGLLAHGRETQGPHQPERFPLDESLDVLAADQGDVLAEPRAVEVDQPMAMAVFLRRHLLEKLGRARIICPETLGIIGVDSSVLLLERDCQAEHLLLAQALEGSQITLPSRLCEKRLADNEKDYGEDETLRFLAAVLGRPRLLATRRLTNDLGGRSASRLLIPASCGIRRRGNCCRGDQRTPRGGTAR